MRVRVCVCTLLAVVIALVNLFSHFFLTVLLASLRTQLLLLFLDKCVGACVGDMSRASQSQSAYQRAESIFSIALNNFLCVLFHTYCANLP